MPRQIGAVQARIEYTGITAVTAALRAMPLERAVRAGARLGGWAMNFDRPNRPIALDLDVRKGVFVDFFGMPASTTDGMARLALATGAPVIPVFMVRQTDSIHHKITILPAIYAEKTRDREKDVREYTQRYTSTLEDMVRAHPDHWNWIHRRWKTRPPGEPRFY